MKRIILPFLFIVLTGLMRSEAQILISKVDPANDLITITNYGASSASVTASWQFCSEFIYISFADVLIVDGFDNFPTLPPGGSVTFNWVIDDNAADLGLYTSTNFTSSADMLHFVQWGGGGIGRESVAVNKGIWSAGDFLTNTTNNPDPVFMYNGSTSPTGESDWMNVVDLTFSVDMSNETVNAAGVHLAGSFQGWDPSSTPMTDMEDGCWMYTLECVKPGDTINFKYINGNMWGQDESVPNPLCGGGGQFGNDRVYVIPNKSDTIPKVCFGKCTGCDEEIPLTLYVDMSNVDSIADSVTVGGTFNGFDPSSTPMTHIGNNIYCVTVLVSPGEEITYKFINGNNYNDQTENVNSGPCAANNGFGDRIYTVPTGITEDTIHTVCFSSCNQCGDLISVTFYVNVCLLDSISQSGIFIGGNFNNFDAGLNPMTDSGDGVWCATINLNANDTIYYKFNNGGSIGGYYEQGDTLCGVDDGFGGFNRVLITTDQDTVLQIVCWNECEDCVKDACPVPPNPNTINIGFFKATLVWDVVNEAAGYELQGGLLGSNPNFYEEFSLTPGTNNSLLATGLTKNTSYEWQVRAGCVDESSNVIYSDWTPLQFFTTLHCAPPNPSTTINITNKKATLQWTPQPNSIGYIIRGQQIGGSVVTVNVPGGGVSSYVATGLSPNTQYAWAAQNVCSLSPYVESVFAQSQINNFTTLPSSSEKTTLDGAEVNVFPNPAEDKIWIKDLSNDKTEIRIFDLKGTIVFEMTTSSSDELIDIKRIPAGIYQLVIEDHNYWRSSKLVISR